MSRLILLMKPTTFEEIKRIARVQRILDMFLILEMITRLQAKGKDSLEELAGDVKLVLEREIDSTTEDMLLNTILR
jgi:hypothetical protein